MDRKIEPNPPQWAIEAANELIGTGWIVEQDFEGANPADYFGRVIARHAPQSPEPVERQPSGSIPERVERAWERLQYAWEGNPALDDETCKQIIAAEFADLPDQLEEYLCEKHSKAVSGLTICPMCLMDTLLALRPDPEAVRLLVKLGRIMCREWREVIGTPEKNRTPNDILERLESALAKFPVK